MKNKIAKKKNEKNVEKNAKDAKKIAKKKICEAEEECKDCEEEFRGWNQITKVHGRIQRPWPHFIQKSSTAKAAISLLANEWAIKLVMAKTG